MRARPASEPRRYVPKSSVKSSRGLQLPLDLGVDDAVQLRAKRDPAPRVGGSARQDADSGWHHRPDNLALPLALASSASDNAQARIRQSFHDGKRA